MPVEASASDCRKTHASSAQGRSAWFLIQTKANQTERAATHLARQQYQVFLPRLSVEKIVRGKRVQVAEPLFPGYLFVHLHPGIDNWQPVRSTRGVLRMVSFGERPLPVPDALISDIQARAEDHDRQAEPAFHMGQPVRIADGPFADCDAIFQCFDGEERVIVLLQMMQRQQRIRLSPQSLMKAADD